MDRDDAAPSRVGQAVTPQQYVMVGIGPDGNLVLDFPDEEMVGRALIQWGACELDRYYTNKRMEKMMERATQDGAVRRMMGKMRGER